MQIDVGDTVLTQHGEERVLSFDLAADRLRTGSGWWSVEDLVPIEEPDLDDPDALERWLRIAARLRPSLGVTTTSVRCAPTCGCRYCHVNQLHDRLGLLVGQNHFQDSRACKCEEKGCC